MGSGQTSASFGSIEIRSLNHCGAGSGPDSGRLRDPCMMRFLPPLAAFLAAHLIVITIALALLN
jgi:hypothetical protein